MKTLKSLMGNPIMNRRKVKRGFLLAIISLFTLTGCGKSSDYVSKEPLGEFAIYTVRGGISAQQMMETDLNDLEVEDIAIISDSEIVSYTEKTHSIELTDAAYEKLARLEIELIRAPFVVYVGREPIYGGAFWVSYLSSSFDGIVIDLLPVMDKHPIRIQLGYPESLELFVGEDLRSDSRILRSLDAAGILQ